MPAASASCTTPNNFRSLNWFWYPNQDIFVVSTNCSHEPPLQQTLVLESALLTVSRHKPSYILSDLDLHDNGHTNHRIRILNITNMTGEISYVCSSYATHQRVWPSVHDRTTGCLSSNTSAKNLQAESQAFAQAS